MPNQKRNEDVPHWLRIVTYAVAFLLLGPIVLGFLVVFTLVMAPFALLILLEGAVEVHGDAEGRPHHRRRGTPRGRATPVGRTIPSHP